MSAGHVSLRHLILGLLTRKPMSGYDIKRFLRKFGWLIRSPSFGSLYPALRDLLQDGLVTEVRDVGQSKRSRRVYSITDKGQEALQQWIDQLAAPDAPLKSFVMRLVLASKFPRAGLIAHLQQRRSQVTAHHAILDQMAGTVGGEIESEARLALDYGLALATAELAWLDSTLNRLSQPLPMQVPQGKSAAAEA